MATDEAIEPQDPRFSRLKAMQKKYVTEESLKVSEPKAPRPDADEEFEGEEAEEFEAEAEPVQEPESQAEEPDDGGDHRVASLRRARNQFVTESDLEHQPEEETPFDFQDEKGANNDDIPRKVCTKCGSQNPMTEAVCTNCGARLPKMAKVEDEVQYAPGSINVTLKKFENALDKFSHGEWSGDEYLDFLVMMHENMRTRSDRILDFAEFTNYIEWSPDEMGKVMEGINEWEVAVEHMIEHVENELYDALDDIMQVMRAANDKLIEALRLNREFRKTCADKLDFNV
ncbi:MAG: zinc ribbon domain-containing protein [Vulcanimicrobiota bacterium]